MILILKPTCNCNFRCKYCYLSNESKKKEIFDLDFAKLILAQVKETIDKKRRLEILWHGGEPLLWGLQNYKEILEYVKTLFEGYNYHVSIQTNLSLINDEFIKLFKAYNVGVSFSIDGPKEINDSQRQFLNGNGTFDVIIEKVKLCHRNGIKLGCVVVASKNHIGKISELYDFMCDNNINFKMNPIFSAGEATKNIEDLGLTVAEYAQMSIELFDLWFNDNKNQISNSQYIEIASSLITKKVSLCVFHKNCQESITAISPNGDVVPCGRFCDNELIRYSYGNLHTETLATILPKIKESIIYERFKYIEESSCNKCEFFDICHGGCLHDGLINGGDFKTKTFLCGAYKRIFSHIKNRLKEAEMIN